jgi:Low psii accumulation1 / Rep27
MSSIFTWKTGFLLASLCLLHLESSVAFTPNTLLPSTTTNTPISSIRSKNTLSFFATPRDDDGLGERFGGYTVKQRLREEVESPFRKVRFLFFLSTVGSALTALYFSGLSTIKALVGGYVDAPPLEEALTSDAINLGGAIVCGFLALREYNVGQANLQRIAKGGQLARLVVNPASESEKRRVLADYRRAARVLIAAGGEDYIASLARSLNADQLADENTIPQGLAASEVILVPVLLTKKSNSGAIVVDNTQEFWKTVQPQEGDRNFDLARSESVVAFPSGNNAWTDYLESEIETASGQGFDVLEKGFTITVKKNGRILRRATGQPPWADFLGAMEVLDGSRFGMPGDSERNGGP